jgi:uncharacterized protein with LGFP repeats
VALPTGVPVALSGGDFTVTVTSLSSMLATVEVNTPLGNGPLQINAAYTAAGGAGGVLGRVSGSPYPTAGGGWTQAFQFGRIHWSPVTGAHAVYGDISRAYDPLRGESGVLGYPVGGRYATPGNGWTQAFQFGRIHSSPGTGAFAVHGDIAKVYDPLRGESGPLGYPVAPQRPDAGGRLEQLFQNGRIVADGGVASVQYR